MIDINKWISIVNVFFLPPQMSNGALLMVSILFFYESIEMDHVKLSFVHDFLHIQSIKMIPFHKFKEVILDAQYKKCNNKIKKTWYSLMKEVFFEFMYKVNFKKINKMKSIIYNNYIWFWAKCFLAKGTWDYC